MDEVKRLWRWITYQRHRSELAVLGRSKGLYIFGFIPIFITSAFWWGLFCLPIAILVVVLYPWLGIFEGNPTVFGWIVFGVIQILALIGLLIAAPWFFHWYFIGLTQSFGLKTMAEKKEKYLRERIAAYEMTKERTST